METHLSFDISKLKSVEVVDCKYVYDIEVKDNHNYFLENNVLVHNSGKSDHAWIKLILDSFELKYFRCLYVNKEFSGIRDQQFSALKKIIYRMNLQDYFKFYAGDYRVQNLATGNWFIPKGMDDPEKTKGIDDITHIFWDEINKGTKEDFTTLNKLLRTPLADYLQFIFCFNPVSDKHWLREFFFDENDWYVQNPKIKDILINHSTYKDNEFINQEAYYQTLITDLYDESQINCDVYGLWGNPKTINPFITTFVKDKHIAKEPLTIKPNLITVISIDFNVSPMTCIVCQYDPYFREINILEEFRQLDSDVYKLCDWIKKNYDTRYIKFTGDSSGNNRHAYSRDSLSGFQIIAKELLLNRQTQFKIPKKKAGYVKDKRLIANAIFSKKNVKINKNCAFLIEDLETVTVTPEGQMNKTKDTTLTHLLDCLCDFFYMITNGNAKNL